MLCQSDEDVWVSIPLCWAENGRRFLLPEKTTEKLGKKQRKCEAKTKSKLGTIQEKMLRLAVFFPSGHSKYSEKTLASTQILGFRVFI